MDWTSVSVALLALLGTLGGSALGIRQSNKIVELRIINLEKKMDKHNNVIERMQIVESELRANGRRLDELEDVHPRIQKG